MPDESYRRRLRSLLLWLCDVIQALINTLVCVCVCVCVCVMTTQSSDDHAYDKDSVRGNYVSPS